MRGVKLEYITFKS